MFCCPASATELSIHPLFSQLIQQFFHLRQHTEGCSVSCYLPCKFTSANGSKNGLIDTYVAAYEHGTCFTSSIGTLLPQSAHTRKCVVSGLLLYCEHSMVVCCSCVAELVSGLAC